MNKWVLVALVVIGLGAALLWQTETLGKVKAREAQFVTTIETLVDAEEKQRKRAELHSEQQAKARKELERINHESNELRKKLEALGGCFDQPIGDDGAQWLQQFRGEN